MLAVLITNDDVFWLPSPTEENRDRLILSKGHACVALYSALFLKGFYEKEELFSYGEDFSNYQYDNQSDNWEWDSTDNRLEFDKMRRNSLVAGMVADFALAGLIINRIISVIDVMYLTNRKSNIDLGSYISRDRNDGVALNISFSIK